MSTAPFPLNPAQRAAVEHDLGPLLVLAGAGSGKTRVVTTRIGRLLERGVPARSILAMTFTNKAAAEMRERVTRIVGAKLARDLVVTTFHSFGLTMLAAEASRLGFKNGQFTIFDQADSSGTVREILRGIDSAGRKFDIGAILARISHAKNHFIDDGNTVEREGDDYDEIAKLVLPRYRAALRGFQAFDFDDLVCEPVRILRKHDDVRERWQRRYRYLLVDEYQDTNHAQLELVRLLAAEHRNVCVVGDDDQSIYAWRGADITNILDFERHFAGAKVVKLEENYRSTSAVLNVANAVLAKSSARRHGKVLRAARPDGLPVQAVAATDADVEASFIADEIKLLREEGIAAKDIAVLYRSALQGEPIETALRERGVPIRTVGGTQFYERKEVKDLLSYMKVAVNTRDEMALRRIINYPARGIGEAALERLESAALAKGESLWDAVCRAAIIPTLPSGAVEGCRQLVAAIGTARASLQDGVSPRDVASALAEAIDLKKDITAGSTSNEVAARRWGNVESILGVFARHHQRGGVLPAGEATDSPPADRPPARADVRRAALERFGELLRFLTLAPPQDEEDAGNVVTLSTMHAAKGLEYKCVFIAGLEEGLMPHQRVLDPRATDVGLSGSTNDIEEERRLFYVSVTRAMDRLYLCRAKHRLMRGKPVPRTPSRFLCELPKELLVEREVSVVPPPATATTAARGQALLAALTNLGGSGGSPAAPHGRPGAPSSMHPGRPGMPSSRPRPPRA